MNRYQTFTLVRRIRVVLQGRRSTSKFRIGLLLVASFSNFANAEEQDSDESQVHYKHKIGLFIGATHVDIEGRSDDKVFAGVDYEYRTSNLLGIGGFVEYANSIDTWTLAPALYVHPSERWRLMVAAGAAFEDSESEFLLRLGVGYEFDFGGWSLSPEIGIDFAGSEVNELMGINIGWVFE